MSRRATSHETCVAAMRAFGYTPRQADFLAHVALHGGYFLRRHYMAFTGHGHGLATVRFLQRLTEREHVRRMPLARHGHLYHLYSRTLYNACGLEGRGWGREASPQRVVEALATLDFVLEHRDVDFLVTNDDKTGVLTDVGLQRCAWPVATRGRIQPDASHRDRATFDHRPWYVDETDGRLWVLYVESGTTLTGARTFLRSHRALLCSMSSGVAYVSQMSATAPVRSLFSQIVITQAAIPAPRDADFLHYCRVRRAAEANDLSVISVAEIRRYRELRPRFASRRYDELFQRWVANPEKSPLRPEMGITQDIDCILRVHHAQHACGSSIL